MFRGRVTRGGPERGRVVPAGGGPAGGGRDEPNDSRGGSRRAGHAGRCGQPGFGRHEGARVGAATRTLSLSEVLARAGTGQVRSAEVDDRAHVVSGVLADGTRHQAAYPPGFAAELTGRLLAGGGGRSTGPGDGGMAERL